MRPKTTDEAQRRYELGMRRIVDSMPMNILDVTLPASQVSTIEQIMDEWSAAYDQYEEARQVTCEQYLISTRQHTNMRNAGRIQQKTVVQRGYPPLYVHCQRLTIVPPP